MTSASTHRSTSVACLGIMAAHTDDSGGTHEHVALPYNHYREPFSITVSGDTRTTHCFRRILTTGDSLGYVTAICIDKTEAPTTSKMEGEISEAIVKIEWDLFTPIYEKLQALIAGPIDTDSLIWSG